MNFSDLYHAPVAKLKAAVDDWGTMAAALKTLADDAHSTMAAKAKDEYWKGVNADVTKPFIDSTAKEFDDLAAEAKGIHAVLDEGYGRLKKAHDEAVTIHDTDAPAVGMKVQDSGKVVAIHPVEDQPAANYGPSRFEALQSEQDTISGLQKRVDAAMDAADDADQSLAAALKADAGQKHNARKPAYSSLEASDAARAAALAKRGAKLNHTQLQQLNELLGGNHTSKEFAKDFYDDLGPKESLVFFGQLEQTTYGLGGKVDKQRLADVQKLQRNLGLTLATATRSSDAWATKWSTQMRHLGTQQLPLSEYPMGSTSPPYGYQLLGGILRYGDDYNRAFLDPIAEHVTQLHAKNPYFFLGDKALNQPGNPFNPLGKDGAGYDPVTAVLQALGHSPDASKHFFADPPHVYDEHGDLVAGAHTPTDADGHKIKNYLDYYTGHGYQAGPDTNSTDPEVAARAETYTSDALGHALESATLGYPYDAPNAAAAVHNRDAMSAGIMKHVVDVFGKDPARATDALSDSLGNIGAGYVDDLNWSVDGHQPDSVFAPAGDPAAHVRLDPGEATGFLSTLGQHPDAYAAVTEANRVYESSVLENQVGPHGQIDHGGVTEAVRTGAHIQGVLDHSRATQMTSDAAGKVDAYNKAMDKRSGWVDLGIGAAVGAGVAFAPITAPAAGVAAILVPLAIDNSKGLVQQYADNLAGSWIDSSASSHVSQLNGQAQHDLNSLYSVGRANAGQPLAEFNAIHHLSRDRRQYLVTTLNAGYDDGTNSDEEMGNLAQ